MATHSRPLSNRKLWWKSLQMRTRYYLKQSLRRVPKAAALLFFISFLAFLVVLLPSLRTRLRNSTLLAPSPSELRVSGFVYDSAALAPSASGRAPLANIRVDVGGHRTTTDSSGAFTMEFTSLELSDVPLVLTFSGRTKVAYLTFAPGKQELVQDFVFP